MKSLRLFVLLLAACGSQTSDTTEAPSFASSEAALDLPAKCYKPQQSLVSVTIKVTEYKGTKWGRNGQHEIVHGEITHTEYSSNPENVSNEIVELAMNIASAQNPSGLPEEIPLQEGEEFTVQGIYMSSTVAKARTAILHFTHEPCGWVTLEGNTFE